jgi:hypothetical protein
MDELSPVLKSVYASSSTSSRMQHIVISTTCKGHELLLQAFGTTRSKEGVKKDMRK